MVHTWHLHKIKQYQAMEEILILKAALSGDMSWGELSNLDLLEWHLFDREVEEYFASL
jgi:hypothetical protein